MTDNFSIPIFIPKEEFEGNNTIKPATVEEKLKKLSEVLVEKIQFDENSLNDCLDSFQSIITKTAIYFKDNELTTLDCISFEVGVSADGKFAILGSGIGLQLASKIILSFKVKRNSQNEHKGEYV